VTDGSLVLLGALIEGGSFGILGALDHIDSLAVRGSVVSSGSL
jgi:hypothetical protein